MTPQIRNRTEPYRPTGTVSKPNRTGPRVLFSTTISPGQKGFDPKPDRPSRNRTVRLVPPCTPLQRGGKALERKYRTSARTRTRERAA